MEINKLLGIGQDWFQQQSWTPFPFQLEAWQHCLEGKSGLINAPTGSGKTYSLLMPILLEFIRDNPNNYGKENNGLQAIWITPIRALTQEIKNSAERAANELGLNWNIAIRTADTKSSERQKQKRKAPELLITTPESLHLLLASKGPKYFKSLQTIVIDEWHELVGSKRGVQGRVGFIQTKGTASTLKGMGDIRYNREYGRGPTGFAG